MSMQEVKVRGQRSRHHRGQNHFCNFRTVTPVWIHKCRWNDAQSLMLHRRGVLLFYNVTLQSSKVTRHKKSSGLTQIGSFRAVTPVWIRWWLHNDAQSLKSQYHIKSALLFFKVICQIPRAFRDCNSSLNSLANVAHSLKEHRRVTLLFSRWSVKFQGHTGQKCTDFDPNRAFPDCNSSLKSQMDFKRCTELGIE